jgi:hypothetical protein
MNIPGGVNIPDSVKVNHRIDNLKESILKLIDMMKDNTVALQLLDQRVSALEKPEDKGGELLPEEVTKDIINKATLPSTEAVLRDIESFLVDRMKLGKGEPFFRDVLFLVRQYLKMFKTCDHVHVWRYDPNAFILDKYICDECGETRTEM